MTEKTAVVTGASRGIGLAVAKMLLEEGYQVFGLSRSPQTPSDPAVSKMIRIPCDVADPASVKDAFDAILSRSRRIDLLINNAGMGISGAAEFALEEEIARQLEVNLTGAIRCAKQAVPVMRRQGFGRIVFVSSLGGIFPLPFQSYYSVSKAGLNAFSDALGLELKPFGVQTSVLLLNDVKTEFTANRRKNISGDELYGGRIEASVHKMELSEQKGMAPEQVAGALCRILRRRRLPPHCIVGFSNQILMLLYRLLPTSAMLWILGKIYG